MERRKIYGTIIGVLSFVLLLVGVTYAYFRWTSTDNNTNVNLIVSKGLESSIVYNQGTSVLETAGATLEAGFDYTDGINTTIEFWKKETSTKTIYGQISLEILNLLSATDTLDTNIAKTDTLKWTITTYNVNDSTEVVVNTGSFKGKSIGSKWAITQDFELNNYQTFYKIYLWIDLSAVDNTKSISGELISTEISASASDTKSIYDEQASTLTLMNLGLDELLQSGTPSFSSVATTDEGIYAAEDDLGTSYYFRGASENNYVKFGKNSSGNDMYWRIIRINGDGTVRMIYDGTQAYENGTANDDRQLTTLAFNNNENNDNTYVGYMTGITGASTYAETHANTNDSTIKDYLENMWYANIIKGTEYEQYVADAIYCNDREVSIVDSSFTGNGSGTSITAYKTRERLYINKSPVLTCKQEDDRFTYESSNFEIGTNGKLKYPVGLITADEVAMAGGVYGVSNVNNSYYLYTGNYYWTISPFRLGGSGARTFYVASTGDLFDYFVYYTDYGVRPVLSLKADSLQYSETSNGTKDYPFVVE